MPAFVWKRGEEEGAFCSLFGLTFTDGQATDCGHLLPWQVQKLRGNPHFMEVPEGAPAPQDTPAENERNQLKAELEAKGINYDKRWGVERLRAALDGGEAAEPKAE